MTDSDNPATGPIPPPAGLAVVAATPRGLTLRSGQELPVGRLMEFELLLGARPLELTGRIVSCRAEAGATWVAELELLAIAQVDRDSLADFLQAVGPAVLHVRARSPD